jgi:hypothetical protein
MSNTTRVNILDRIEYDLKNGVSDLLTVEVLRKPTITSVDTVLQPAAFIYPGPERKIKGGDSRSVIGKENWEWTVFIEVWAMDTDMEALLGSIHTVMYADYTFNKYAVYSERESVVMWVVDPDEMQQAMLLEYSVIYRHTLGTM